MHIYLAGDELLHVSSPTECTGFAATHTGRIEMRVVVLDSPPAIVDWDWGWDWDAISETTRLQAQETPSPHPPWPRPTGAFTVGPVALTR